MALDRALLWSHVLLLREEHQTELLRRALGTITDADLATVVKPWIDASTLNEERAPSALVEAVDAFYDDSLRGFFYDSFDVDSRNWREKSRGTKAWLSEYARLVAASCDASPTSPEAARHCFELLFDLLDRLDDGDDEIVFFADEAGSWQVGMEWGRVMPAWASALAATTDRDEFALEVWRVLGNGRPGWAPPGTSPLRQVLEFASDDQAAALDELKLCYEHAPRGRAAFRSDSSSKSLRRL